MTGTDSTPIFASLTEGAILVPVDMRHKDDSEKALDMAARLARQSESRLHIVTVANPLGVEITDMPESREPDFRAYVNGLSDYYGIEIFAEFRSHESPESAILAAIGELEIGLVVMHTHQPRKTDCIFGSHAAHIVRDAPCSVLAIR